MAKFSGNLETQPRIGDGNTTTVWTGVTPSSYFASEGHMNSNNTLAGDFSHDDGGSLHDAVSLHDDGDDAKAVKVKAPRSGNRTLVVLAIVAVLSLLAGFGLSQLIVNPAEVAARTAPPEAGLITVPIEHRELANDVTLRGDVLFDGATSLSIEVGEMAIRAIVTGQIPELGSQIDAGSVILEVAGRPVIALEGDLPTFRTLRMGLSGPDVIQLREALSAIGINAGDLTNDVFDVSLANAITALYQRVGYPLPEPPAALVDAQHAAELRVSTAEANVTRAERDLAEAAKGPDAVQIAAADAQVSSAQRQVDTLQTALNEHRQGCLDGVRTDCTLTDMAGAEAAVANARDAFNLAMASRQALDTPPNTTFQNEALTEARRALTEARADLVEAQQAILPHFPASEVVYLNTLPRRVDSINVRRGDTVTASPVMTISGAELLVTSSAAPADAVLLEVGAEATIDAGGQSASAIITEIRPPAEPGGRSTIILEPQDLTPEQVMHFRGMNVRVQIPVSSTGGAVLTVPLAALTAGPGGESRIEVQNANGTTSLVEVNTGLAAGGHVEVTGVDRDLHVGDLVVIGTATGADQGTV